MRIFSNRFCRRGFSVFFLVLFVHSLFTPFYALALTSGPHQPEFTSYEDAGSTDMVNLATGDFNFNIPVIDVPGPEGNFSLPLSYHAGIGLEQEASWTGLGWNLNAGAILRNVNQYPDDASGEGNQVIVQDLTGVTGWNRMFNHPFRDDWNSQTGYHGNVNLLDIVEVDFGSMTSVGIVGVHVGDGGVSFDGVQFTMAVINIVSWGIGSAGTTAVSVAKQAAIDLAISTAVSFAMPVNTPGSPSGGNWRYSKSSSSSVKFHGEATLIASMLAAGPFPIFSRKKSYKIWLDQSRTEDMYGVLNLGDANQNLIDVAQGTVSINSGQIQTLKRFSDDESDRGAASDMNFTVGDNVPYPQHSSPNVLATDNYTVNAPGISGGIAPYRLDIGSLSMPREMSEFHIRLAPLPYLNNYKVPFIYEGSLFNRYFHHVGGLNQPTSPSFHYGLDVDATILTLFTSDIHLSLNDAIFDQRIHPDNVLTKKVPQGNNIDWLTNAEIRNAISSTVQAPPSKFVDFLSAEGPEGNYQQSDRYLFRSHYTLGTTPVPSSFSTYTSNFNLYIPVSDPNVLGQIAISDAVELSIWESATGAHDDFTVTVTGKDSNGFTINNSSINEYLTKSVNISFTYYGTQNAKLQKGIGGYSITSADGATYHFALPIYDYDQKSESVLVSDENKKTIIKRTSPFANTWLLTAITGPDFIDRNSNGLADEGDWGYWVKMNYGKHTDSFDWRIPYEGEMTDYTGTIKSYEQGKKQLYYLNSIETRSHVALFMKSAREDGKSVSGTVAPLKLDEICLLKKEHYKSLLTGTASIADYSNKIAPLCLSSDFANSSIREYINRNCIKRVIFQYSYDLCKSTPNAGGSNNPQSGKLTLKGISVKGRNDLKVVPDFNFEYNINNPNYNPNAWDGWGMYNVNGTTAHTSHSTSDPTGANGTSWSLSKIVTPLGGEILVNYERDSYSSISGELVYGTQVLVDIPLEAGTGPLNYLDVVSDKFQVGDNVILKGDITYTCPGAVSPSQTLFEAVRQIVSIDNNRITFNQSFVTPSCSQSGAATVYPHATISKGAKKGGNIRVASIALTDPMGRSNKVRYLYDETAIGSSGVVAQEPEFIKSTHYSFYDYLKYPQTPVMYGRVSVLSGRLTNDSDYDSKQVFEFETPHKSLMSLETIDEDEDHDNLIDEFLFKIEDRTAKIGKLKSIKVYDVNNNMTSESQLLYTDKVVSDNGDQYQGVFSEGTLLSDFSAGSGYLKAKSNRTTVITYPYALKKIVNKKDGFNSSTENLKWDNLTGTATEKLSKSSLGIYIKSVTEPAYKFYPELGSKALNNETVDNKNMLLQNAATYEYRSDPMGNQLGLISATAQTWTKDWNNYRSFNGTSYVDEGTQQNPIWRKGAAYVWKGNFGRLQPGYGSQSFNVSDEFNFSGSNLLWQYLGEVKRFDHFGMPLESVDKNNIYASVKMGYDNRTIIASASNAKYNEIAFSSAEDKIPGENYFGGEVALGSGTLVTNLVHTGNTALSLSSGYGFIFKSTDLSTTKSYRASVWANSPNGRIYYKLNSGAEVVPAEQTVSPAVAIPGMGNWYRIDLRINSPSSSVIEIGVKSSSGTVVFDDFRFQPADAVMTCYVNSPLDYEFTVAAPAYSPSFSYSLDNDNLFTKVEVNEKGEVVKVFAESLKYGVKLVSESKSNYRRASENQ